MIQIAAGVGSDSEAHILKLSNDPCGDLCIARRMAMMFQVITLGRCTAVVIKKASASARTA